MKQLARVLLLSAALVTPAYLFLDGRAVLPLALRDRPWPLALLCVALAFFAQRLSRRKVVPLLVALLSLGALGAAAFLRYRLPPSSPSSQVGGRLPDVVVHDQSGAPVKLRALQGPLLLVWFRGSWCPYCRRQLADIAAEEARFPAAHLRVLAVSVDPTGPLQTLRRELQLSFPLLSDPERQLADQCEVGHCVALLDSSGVIRWGVVSGNWERDLPARALLQALYREN